jgi:hypothetical protein
MGLNKKGILQLADDLVAHKKLYDQSRYGARNECGTVCCMAGFCKRREVGARTFGRMVAKWMFSWSGSDVCAPAGSKQLGVPQDPQIFEPASEWPLDLSDIYFSNGANARVRAALLALQRLREDGSIDPDPNAVHTRIPQLKQLLKAK